MKEGYNEYRKNLAKEIQDEPDKEKRQGILKSAKESQIYREARETKILEHKGKTKKTREPDLPEPTLEETERVVFSKARRLAEVRRKIEKESNLVDPSVREAVEFLRPLVDEDKTEIQKLEKDRGVQIKAFKGKVVPPTWGHGETIESLRKEVQSYNELIEYLSAVADHDRKLGDIAKKLQVPTDELLDMVDEVKEKIRGQVGGNLLGRAQSLQNWHIKKYDQVMEILVKHANELNAAGLSVNKVEELIERNKGELEKARLTKIAREIADSVRQRLPTS